MAKKAVNFELITDMNLVALTYRETAQVVG